MALGLLASPGFLLACAAWPAWSRLLRGWADERVSGSVEPVVRPAWGRVVAGPLEQPPACTSPIGSHAAVAGSEVAPAAFKIQCIPLEPAEGVPHSVRQECDQQAAAGRRLVSSFTHDGHVFLVFQRP